MNTVTTDASNTAATATPEVVQIPVGTATSKEFVFNFRTDKVRDDEGKVISKGRKHPDVKAVLPIPTFAALAALIAAGGKEAELVLDSVIDTITLAARQQINTFREDKGLAADFTPTAFNLDQLSLAAIANMPKSERGGPAISDEDWTAFLEDYTNVMVTQQGYDAKRVGIHVMHFKSQIRRVKNDKPVVQKLLDLLNAWATATENLEDHMTIYQDLAKRCEKYLKADEKNLMDAL